MKQQVVLVPGGEAFSDYDIYLSFLRTVEFDPRQEKKRWRLTLAEELGEDFEFFLLEMPNRQNAKYEEWKIWFEKYFDYLDDNFILIGSSLGALFLQRYLIENEPKVHIKALFLVAPPVFYSVVEATGEDGGDFNFDNDKLPLLSERTDKIVIFHSQDDFVVPYEHALKLKEMVPEAELITFSDRNHFLQPGFPELIAKIKKLAG